MTTHAGDLEASLNLGALLVDEQRYPEALAHYQRALEVHPQAPALWCDLGVLHSYRGAPEAAERCSHQALALEPSMDKARFNLGMVLLREGRWDSGWEAFESRAWNLAMRAQVAAPPWEGESLQGKALLIGPEGGFGDMIQFCRYVPLLKRQGASRIGLICQRELVRLFETLPGLDAVVALGDPIPGPDWDFWTLPLSLPLRCGTRLDSVPSEIPYLHPRTEWIEAWRPRLPEARLRVGLAWQGNPLHGRDAERSLPSLVSLAPLASPEVQFVSLQKGDSGLELAAPGLTCFDPSPWIEDFADTAGLLAHLDLVITVDTAAAHLAGALGRPCWVLLPSHADWRWLKALETSPWYPKGLRLFRQGSEAHWDSVVLKVAAAFRAFCASAEPGPGPVVADLG